MKLKEYSERARQYFVPFQRAEDLPRYALSGEIEDLETRYCAELLDEIQSDTDPEFTQLLADYNHADEVGRSIINHTLVRLCGYSLPNLVRIAHGEEPE